MNKIINKVKNMLIVVTLIFGLTACDSKSIADIYDNDSKIAGNSNSYNLINCEQSIEEQNYKCCIEKFEGMDTVWICDAAEAVSAELSFFASVYDGKMKLVLIAPDGSLTTIAELTPETKLEDFINYTINLKKGKNRIKVVAGKDTKFDIDLFIPIGEFEKLGY